MRPQPASRETGSLCLAAVRRLIETGLQQPNAADAWAGLTETERLRVTRYMDHGLTSYGKRKRARQMLTFLGFGPDTGPDSVRAFFGPLHRMPTQPTPYVR
jgi:hypothetical protein